MLEGALILLAGILVGRFAPARRRKPKPPKPAKPICGCGHHLAQHDRATDSCHALIPADKYDVSRMQCTCKQYTGIQPMPEYFAPEVGG
jgi:hypothetical protein